MDRAAREALRARTVTAASTLLDTPSATTFTIDALVRALGISRSTLYAVFRNKDEIVLAAVDRRCAALDAAHRDHASEVAHLASAWASHLVDTPAALLADRASLPRPGATRLDAAEDRLRDALASAAARTGARHGSAAVFAVALCEGLRAAALAATRGLVSESRSVAVHDALACYCPEVAGGAALAS